MKKWSLIPRFFSLVLLLLACLLALKDGLRMDWWSIWDMILICSLVSAFVTVTYYNRLTMLCGILLGTAVEAGLIFLAYERLSEEWLGCFYHTIPLINAYYRTNFPYEVRSGGDSRVLLIFLVLLLGLWMGQGVAYGRKRLLALIPAIVCFSGGLLLGYGPKMGAVLCLVGGLGIGLLVPRSRDEAAEHRSRQLVFLCLCAAVGVTALVYRPLSEKLLAHHEEWKAWQLKQEDKMLALMDDSEFLTNLFWNWGSYAQRAALTNQPPGLTDREILTVTTAYVPRDPIYLKNFTGVYYDNGVWYPASAEEFAGLAEEQQMSTEDYGALVQGASIEKIISDVGATEMTIEILRRTGSSSPMPYFSTLPEEAEIVGDTGVRVKEGMTYQVRVCEYLNLVPDESRISSWNSYTILSDTEFADRMAAYVAYATEMYRRLPAGQLERLSAEKETAGKFLQHCSYSFDLEPVPEGQDIVEYFIFEQQKGYCMHFASAYTLWARMLNLPARYASGYLVRPKDFRENEDGTFTAVVTEERAHAWMETLFEGIWFPVEVTPRAYFNSLLEEGDQRSVTDIVASIQEPEPQQEPEEQEQQPQEPEEQSPPPVPKEEQPENMPDSQEPDGQKGGNGVRGSLFGRLWSALSILLYPLLAVGGVLAVILLRVKLILHFREKRFRDPEPRRAAGAVVRETFRLLRLSGIVFTGTEDEGAFAREAESTVPYLREGEFVEFIEIARVARYSREPISEGQMQYLYMIYRRIKTHEAEQMNRCQRIYYRYIRVLV